MADRNDTKPDRPFGPDTAETPHIDLRTGERARPVPETPEAETEPMPMREVAADEVVSGERHSPTLPKPGRGQDHRADHSVTPPSGSTHAAVETPESGRSTKALIGVVVAVIVILALFFLIPGAADAMQAAAVS
ncbi:hypothetical protein [Jannaschia formosa]|uniref:hypothetical protein n=1 Tax=Jannaschia formosa TaxID=2259592 RepID=UPI000E1BB7A8|nr:hypothetical protein [Jannaschia formosa]TFL20188.1 hypothetical protein DR046_02250 [Jannaschia formosa]